MDTTNPTKVADALKQSWVYRLLPQSLWPYAQLARWERPIGWQLLMWPGLWSIMLAAAHSRNSIRFRWNEEMNFWGMFTNMLVSHIIPTLILFVLGAIIMRGAGCTYNDLADINIDNKVTRTRSRPLPSGRVTKIQAILFLALQLLIGLIILLQFSRFTFWLGAASLVTVAVYPFMKRITWWPQLFLGFAFSWGALLGWSVFYPVLTTVPILLYLGSICWVIGYDTIYAHQDKEDDAIIGVKSTARFFGDYTKTALILLYSVAIMLFVFAATFALWANLPAMLSAWLGLGLGYWHMLWQIKTLDIDDADQCLKMFKSNYWFGWIIFVGFFAAMFFTFVPLNALQ